MTPQHGPSWQNLRYALYFTAHDVSALLLPPGEREEVLRYFAELRADKVYLELGAPAEFDQDAVRALKEDLERRGYAVAAAVVPADRQGPYCYNDPARLARLRAQAEFMAAHFNEIIVDDWLFTVCRCPSCVAGRGERTWAGYRGPLVAEKTREYFIAPAKRVNPGVKLIVKFPNWYEGHHHNGYAVRDQVAQFDEFCIGIETRNHRGSHQHLPTYMGYFLQKWLERVDPTKRGGCWFDNYGMSGYAAEYIAQVYQGVLGGSREIVVWCAGTHYRTNPWGELYASLERELPRLDAVAGNVAAAVKGAAIYMPFGSDGEHGLPGYLGQLGLPLQPVTEFPADDGPVILSKHALRDGDLVGKVLRLLERGGEAVLTGGAFQTLRHTELGQACQVVAEGGAVAGRRFNVSLKNLGERRADRVAEAEGEISFPRMLLTTWPYDNTVALRREDGDYAVLVTARFLNGRLHILNLPENLYDLFRLPAEVLEAIRRIFLPTLGAYLRGPAGTALYAYEDGTYAFYNLTDRPVETGLVSLEASPEARWRDVLADKALKTGEEDGRTTLGLALGPYEMAVVKCE